MTNKRISLIIVIIVVLIVVGLGIMLGVVTPKTTPTPTSTPTVTQETGPTIEQDLNSIDIGNIDNNFQPIDSDINNL